MNDNTIKWTIAVCFCFFILFIGYALVNMHEQQQRCESLGGTYVWNRDSGGLCYPKGSFIKIN